MSNVIPFKMDITAYMNCSFATAWTTTEEISGNSYYGEIWNNAMEKVGTFNIDSDDHTIAASLTEDDLEAIGVGTYLYGIKEVGTPNTDENPLFMGKFTILLFPVEAPESHV